VFARAADRENLDFVEVPSHADGSWRGTAGIQIDVAEEVAREQMNLHAHLMRNMAEGVVLVSADSGNILYTNLRLNSMLGYAPGQLLGQPLSVVNGGSDAEAQALAHSIMAALRTHREWRGELKNRCADGREIWVSATVSELVHEGFGKVWVSVHTDINDRRMAQHARDEALAQLRRLSLNIQNSIEAERLELSRELHDELGATLTGLRMKLESLAGRVQTGGAVRGDELLALAETARNTQLAAREICTRLRPPMLDDIGLPEACRWYLDDWSERVGITARSRFGRLSGEPDARLATDMFRVMQELLTNVARHAAATEVLVVLCHGPSGFVLRVRDNGHGFAQEQASPGFGLIGVQERVRQHAGQFRLKTGTSGTTVTVSMQSGSPA
jgi:two-component system sensor histidine kinase UhpB